MRPNTDPKYTPFDFQEDVLKPVRNKREGDAWKNWGLAFTNQKAVDAFNALNQKIHDNFAAVNPEVSSEPTDKALNDFLKDIEESDKYLNNARAEIEARRELRRKEKDLKKDLVSEQIEDVLFTLAMANPLDSIEHIKTKFKSAVMGQVLAAGGMPPALAQAIEDIIDIKATLTLWKNNPMLFINFLVNNGAGLLDAVAIALLSAKLLQSPLIPEDVAEQAEKTLAHYQEENDRKMVVIIDDMVHKLEAVSKKGFLPTDEVGRKKIQLSLDAVRKHMDDLRERTRIHMENDESDKKLDQMDKRLKELEGRCKHLHMWKPLLQSDIKLARAGHFIEHLLGEFTFLGDKLQTAANAIDLKRALYSNAEIAMSMHTYQILGEHKTFSSAKKHAEFLVGLEAQLVRGNRTIDEIAARYKFIRQSSTAQDDTLVANQTVLNRRKLAVAEELATECTMTFDYDLEQLLDRSLTEEAHKENAKRKMLETVQLLEQLKSSEKNKRESDRKSVRLNNQMDEIINRVKRRYETAFPDDINEAFVMVEADDERLYRANPRETFLRVPTEQADLNVEPLKYANAFFDWLKEYEAVATETAMSAKDAAQAAFSLRQIKKENAQLEFALGHENEFQRQIAAWDKQWASMATIFSDPMVARAGAPKFKSDQRIKMMQERSKELADHHQKLITWLEEKNHLKPNSPLDPRAAYLADMTPYALGKFIDRLDSISMSSSSIDTAAADINYTREEIAISMFERLLLAQENKPADLVAQAKLVAHFCESYRLSDTDICVYREFIEKYGTAALKAKAAKELKPSEEILHRLAEPFNNALNVYWEAGDAKDDEAVFNASQALIVADRSLLTPADEENLGIQQRIIDRDVAFLKSYEEAKLQQETAAHKKWDEKAESAVLKGLFQREEHPRVTAEKSKKVFSNKVAEVMSPIRIVNSDWGFRAEKQRTVIDEKIAQLENEFASKAAALTKKIKACEERVASYKNATAVGKFFRSISGFSFSLIPPRLFRHDDDDKKRQSDLDAVNTELARAKAERADAKDKLDAAKEQLKKQTKKVVEHVVRQVREEIIFNDVKADEIQKVKKFVGTHAPELSKTLDRNIDFLRIFLEDMANGDSVSVLYKVLRSMKIGQPDLADTAEKLLGFLYKGGFPVEPGNELRPSVMAAIKKLTDALDPEEASKLGISAEKIYKSVLNNYIEPLIITDLEGDINDINVEKTRTWLTLFDLPKLVFNNCIARVFGDEDETKEISPSQNRLHNLFALMPAFSHINGYAAMRDKCFQDYFEKRMQHVLANLDQYTETEVKKDLAVLNASRAALLKTEEENPCVAEKILAQTIQDLLSKKPEPKWNAHFTRLIESCGYIDPAVVAAAAKTQAPSWIAAVVVNQFGASEQYQEMNARWMQNALETLRDEDRLEKPRDSEIVLGQLIGWWSSSTSGSAGEKMTSRMFSDFVGEHNVERIEKQFEEVMALVLRGDSPGSLDMSSVTKQSDLNAFHQNGGDQVASALKLGYNPLITTLLPAFSVDSTDDFALRLKAQEDLKVFAKEFASFALVGADNAARDRFDVAGLNQELLKSAEDRQVTKEEKRAALHAQKASDAEAVELLVTGVREYNYATHPDIYYAYYLLPAQKFCYQSAAKAVSELLDNVDQLKIDAVAQTEIMTKQFKRFRESAIIPLSRFDEVTHVLPIITLLMSNVGGDFNKLSAVQALKESMLRLASGDVTAEAAFCRQWCKDHAGDNKIALSAVKHYVTACEQAEKIRQLSDGLSYFINVCCPTMERNLVDDNTPGEIDADFANNIKNASRLLQALLREEKNETLQALLREVMTRFSTKVEKWIQVCEQRVAEKGEGHSPYVRSLLSAIIDAYGTDAQKKKFATSQVALLIDAHKKAFLSTGKSIDDDEMKKQFYFVDEFGSAAQKKQFDGYRYAERLLNNLGEESVSVSLRLEIAKQAIHAVVMDNADEQSPQSPVEGVVVSVNPSIANAMGGYDKEILKQGILASLNALSVHAIENCVLFAKLLGDEAFTKAIRDKVKELIKPVLANPKADPALTSACIPLLLVRGDDILSDAVISEYVSDAVARQQTLSHSGAIGGISGMNMGIAMQRTESQAKKARLEAIYNELKTIVELIPEEHRKALALKNFTAEKPGAQGIEKSARKEYGDAVEKVLALYQPKSKPTNVKPVASAILASVFSYDKNAESKQKLIALRALYASFAEKKFGFSDTSKIFDKKGQTAEGATAIMLEKVLGRYDAAMKNEKKRDELLQGLYNSASYKTLDEADLLPKNVPSMKPGKTVSDLQPRSPFDLPPPGAK